MDHAVAFPNPVERTDLPVPRRKWRYLAAAAVVCLLIAAALLPQILSSKVGRRLLKTYLESEYRGQVWMESFKTSWGGPTTITRFSLTDPEGRQIRFMRLDTQLSLWNLLTRKLDLKEAKVSGLHIEYVTDYGDGADTFDRLGGTPPGATVALGSGAGSAPRAMPELPRISGKIQFDGADLILTRGQIQEKKQFRTAYRSIRFHIAEGMLDIASLDQPFACQLDGTVGPDENAGTFSFSGTFDLGESGKLDWAKAVIDAKVEMADVPNAAAGNSGSLGWIMLPLVPAEDYAQIFGPTLTRASLLMKAEGGKLRLDQLEVAGQTPGGVATKLSGRPMIDMAANPRVLIVDSPLVLSGALTAELAELLSPVNPFLHDAGSAGLVEVTLAELKLPLRSAQKKTSAQGQITVKDGRLVSGAVFEGDAWPREITTQWQAIMGSTAALVSVNIPRASFSLQNGVLEVEPHAMSIDGVEATLSGEHRLDGKLKMGAQARLPSGRDLALSITGTLEQPKLEPPAASTELSDQIDRNVIALRQRKSERLLEKSAKSVEGMLQAFERKREEGK